MEMDWDNLPNNMAISNFVEPCEFRGLHAQQRGDGSVINTPVCGKVAELAGMSFGVDVLLCAQCRLHGTVDETYVRGLSFGACMKRLEMAVKRVHKGPVYIVDLATRALALAADENARATLDLALINLVALGQLGIEDVKAILRQHSYHPDQHPIHEKLKLASELRAQVMAGPNAPQQCCGDKPPIVTPHPSLAKSGMLDTLKAAGQQMVKSAVGASKAAVQVARFAFGGEADEAEQHRRYAICAHCPLFTPRSDAIGPTCGAAYWDKMNRDEKLEGCGCVLNLKITGAGEKCPQEKW